VSTAPTPARPADLVSGFLAVISIVASVFALFYHPVEVSPFATVVALVAAGMAPRGSRLPLAAVGIATICFVVGMTIAVTTNHSLY
jgi:hypothetical protein